MPKAPKRPHARLPKARSVHFVPVQFVTGRLTQPTTQGGFRGLWAALRHGAGSNTLGYGIPRPHPPHPPAQRPETPPPWRIPTPPSTHPTPPSLAAARSSPQRRKAKASVRQESPCHSAPRRICRAPGRPARRPRPRLTAPALLQVAARPAAAPRLSCSRPPSACRSSACSAAGGTARWRRRALGPSPPVAVSGPSRRFRRAQGRVSGAVSGLCPGAP